MQVIRMSKCAALVVLAVAGSVFAQPSPAPAGPGMMARDMHTHHAERMAERHAQRMESLKSRLQLSAGQEAAWKTFAQAMQPPGQDAERHDPAALAKLSTPERLEQMQAMHARHDALLKQRAEATKAFYAGLTAEQKKVFDAETARFMGQRGHHHHGHG